MFTHLIILKKRPWYIYAGSQQDALKVCKVYQKNVVGVVLAPDGLLMQEIEQTFNLKVPEVNLIEMEKEGQVGLDPIEDEQIALEILKEKKDE